MRLFEFDKPKSSRPEFIPNPFPQSKIKRALYHGSPEGKIEKFHRTDAGVWFAESYTWAKTHYAVGVAGTVYACYVDVRNIYEPTDDENDEYYGEMEKVPEFFRKLAAEGYDAYNQGGESGSIAVFKTVPIVNAISGKPM
jgi:hypothetical protein